MRDFFLTVRIENSEDDIEDMSNEVELWLEETIKSTVYRDPQDLRTFYVRVNNG